VAIIFAGLLLRQRAQAAEETEHKNSALEAVGRLEDQIAKLSQKHAAEIEKLNAKGPRLHGVWNNSQTFWHLGRRGQEPMMQIGGWIDLTSSNTDEVIYLLTAYIDEQRSDIFIDVSVKPNIVNRDQVVLYMVPSLESDSTKPFAATVIVEDQHNRKYELPRHIFRATPGQAQIPQRPSLTALPLVGDQRLEAMEEHSKAPTVDPPHLQYGEGNSDEAFMISSEDDYTVRVQKHDWEQIRGLALVILNQRLSSLGSYRITIGTAQSFDARHDDYRDSVASRAIVIQKNEPIDASGIGRAIWFIRNDGKSDVLFIGEDNSHPLRWPVNDLSHKQMWKFSIRIDAESVRIGASPASPLKPIAFSVSLTWDVDIHILSLNKIYS